MALTDMIQWECRTLRGCCVLRPRGELNAVTYRPLRDGLVKFAMDQPDAVVVDVTDLRIAAEPLLMAFSSAWMLIGDWPAVPIMLVVPAATRRAVFTDSAISRYVPVFASLPAALAAVHAPPSRRLAAIDLLPILESSAHARRFVRDMCVRWDVPEAAEEALVVATELVENALVHTHGELRIRLELRGELLTVAVSDDDPHEAVLRETVAGPMAVGLRVVADLARAWGCAPQLPGGKVVWASLPIGGRRQPG